MQFMIANKTDLAQIVNIYNQSIPTRLATADLKPVTVAEQIGRASCRERV